MASLPAAQLIVTTLIRSVPGICNVPALVSVVLYAYWVAGCLLS